MIPYDLFTTENFMRDVITGCFIVGCTMGIFVCLLYLREQFMQGAFQNFWVSSKNGAVCANNSAVLFKTEYGSLFTKQTIKC